MTQYARDTKVSVDSSEAEIKRTAIRYGADMFGTAWDSQRNLALVTFRIQNRHVKMLLPLPDKESDQFKYTAVQQYLRTPENQFKEWEQACKQRWRALALVVKAKLEAVTAGISTVEREFLSDIVLPDGRTFGEWAEPQVERMYLTGEMPPLLPMLTAGPSENGR